MADSSDSSTPCARGNCRSTGGATLWTSLLILVTLVWGNSFIAIKHIVEYVTPLELVTVRFVPVALTFAVMLLPTRRRQVWQMIRTEGWRLASVPVGAALRIRHIIFDERRQT